MSAITAGRTPRVLGSSGTSASVTGTLAETQLAAIAVPANLLGPNGALRITTVWTYTNSANNKTLNVRYSGSGGTQYLANVVTTSSAFVHQVTIYNRNNAAAQIAGQTNSAYGIGGSTTSAVDTTAATTVYISGQLANAGETITLQAYTVESIPGV
jgi:hypothetical protein